MKTAFATTLIVVGVVALFVVGVALNFVSCSKQFSYDHIVVDINGHYVYFDSTSQDWLGNREDAKTFLVGDTPAVGTNMIIYEFAPDPKCYEYTAAEFSEHICSPDADWRCPHGGHEIIN